ncbi:MAG: polysaccharide pyruvyl transferase family protein [Candidatus Hydrogenedentes bacterium]|nr:polysaccharide pyruvyl transferase family protein [Candidatus Hydrogenedentota bacterium]
MTIRDLLVERIPDLELEVICANSTFVEAEHGLPALSQMKELGRVFHHVWRNDGLLLGGGTPFYNDLKHMAYFWVLACLCRLGGGKLVVYGASAQRLHTRSARFFTRRIMEMADLITVREPLTKTQLENDLGVRNQIICTADPAITLTSAPQDRIDAILKAEGLAGVERPLIAICPHFFSNTDPYRVHHYEVFQDDHIETQREVLCRAAEHLRQYGHVVFLPMNTDLPDSDVVVQQEMRERLSNVDGITFVETQYRPKEIAGIFERCKLVVGVRLHALIMASAVYTPVVGINYAPKVQGFMDVLGEPEHCLSLKGLTFESLRVALDAYFKDYDGQQRAFVEHVKALQARAQHNADLVARLFAPR